MSSISVLFVDDEADIRHGFKTRFAREFTVQLASNGREALDVIRGGNGINVVVTDIRMPEMTGLELLAAAKDADPDLGFIVVSGHGDSDDIINAFRLGARNFIRKPYRFAELERAVIEEGQRYSLVREQRAQLAEERAADRYLTGVQRMTFRLPTSLDWINAVTVRLVSLFAAMGICTDESRFNVAMGLVEILTNSVEHGNLGITGPEKAELKGKGEQVYQSELRRRLALPECARRAVIVEATCTQTLASVTVTDEGPGFEFSDLPDPTDPENLFKPSGRGIMLARAFLDGVEYSGRGNTVILTKFREGGSA